MTQHVLILLAISYMAFVFTSNMLNPFRVNQFRFSNTPSKKKQHQLGRAVALCSLVAGIVALLMTHFFGIDRRLALLIYVCGAAILILPSLVKYRRRSLWR